MRSLRPTLALVLSCWIALASHLHAQIQVTTCVGATSTFEVPITSPPTGPVSWQDLSTTLPGEVLYVDNQRLIVRWTEDPGSYVLVASSEIGAPDVVWDITIAAPFEATLAANRGTGCGNADGQGCWSHCLDDGSFELTASPQGTVTWNSTGPVLLSNPSGQSVTVSYGMPGNFTVTALVTNASGCSDSVTYCGAIYDAPEAAITENSFGPVDDINICRGQELTFQALTSLPAGYFAEWRLDNDLPVQASAFTREFDAAGVYTLRLFIGHNCGCVELADQVTITVEDAPGYEVLCPQVVCAGSTTSYVVDLANGQGRTCPLFTVTASVGGQGIPVNDITSSAYEVTWPANPISTMGRVTITPDPSCGGCSSPTVIDVPILGTSTNIERIFNCASSYQPLGAPNIPGASYTWSVTDPGQTIQSSTPFGLGGQSFGVTFRTGAAGFGAPATVTLSISYLGAATCTSTSSIDVVQGPSFALTSTNLCVGQTATIATQPAGVSFAGSASYELHGQTGTVDFSSGTFSVGPLREGLNRVTLNNFVVAGVSYPRCTRFVDINVPATPPVLEIIGPDAICPGGTYLYSALPSAPPTIQWSVIGGNFLGSDQGGSVIVEWDGSGNYQLSAMRVSGACSSEEIVIEPHEIDLGTPEVIGNPNPCVDAPDAERYDLFCGGGQVCSAATNIVWTVNPAVGSITSGQGTASVEVDWHLPLLGDPSAELSVTFKLCEELFQLAYLVTLQFPEERDLTVVSNPVCAGAPVTFEVEVNTALELLSAEWSIQDQNGTPYPHTQPQPTVLNGRIRYTWDSGAAMPEVTAGFGRVFVRLNYDNCGFIERAGAPFELLFNPIPQVSYVDAEENCDGGVAVPSPRTLITSTSGQASEVYFIWERVCPPGGGTTEGFGVEILAEGFGISSLPVVVDPNSLCCYRVTTRRVYTRAGVSTTCERTSVCERYTWNCGEGCGGFCPEIVIGGNPLAPTDADISCGRVVATAFAKTCTGATIQPIRDGLTYGAWDVFPRPIPPLSIGIISSDRAEKIEEFTNVPWAFERFTKPLVYYLSYEMERGNTECGKVVKPIEITLIPGFTHAITCSDDPEYYDLRLYDNTDVMAGAEVHTYAWTVRDLTNNAMLSVAATANPTATIPARTISYEMEVCLTTTADRVHVDPGTPYACQVCRTILVPGAPIAEFTTSEDRLCAGTAIEFVYVDPRDVFGTFVWDFGDNSGSTLAQVTKVYDQAGSYEVTLTHTNSIGCFNTSHLRVDINEGGIAGEVNVEIVEPCQTSAVLTFLPDPDLPGQSPIRYRWSPVASNNAEVQVTTAGVYTVEVRDDLGCKFVTPPVGVMLQDPFPVDFAYASPICRSTAFSLLFRSNPNFTYTYFVDGVPRGAIAGGNLIFLQPNSLSVGVHTVVIRASANGVSCGEEVLAFSVVPAPPVPNIIQTGLECSPFRVTYASSDGSVVRWFVNNQVRAIASTLTLGFANAGDRITAQTPGVECASGPSNQLIVPRSPVPSIVAGCFVNCADLPQVLADASGQSFSYWRWHFVPEVGNSTVCTPPGPGTGTVTPWTNYRDCGNGKFYLETRVTYAGGTVCTGFSDELCVMCPDTVCDAPGWIAQDAECAPLHGQQRFYVNFNTAFDATQSGLVPCINGIEIFGGTLEGQWRLTIEGNAYNLEGLILAPAGVDPDDICLDIPYCDGTLACCSAGVYCDVASICVGALPNNQGACQTDCNVLATLQQSRVNCVEARDEGGAILDVDLGGLRFDLPDPNCIVDDVYLYTINGSRGPITTGGQGDRLDVQLINGEWVVPAASFRYITYAEQRIACFQLLVKYRCPNDQGGFTYESCATSICIDIPRICYPPRNPGLIPEVTCESIDEDCQRYSVFVPFGEEQAYDESLAFLAASFGAEGTLSNLIHEGDRVGALVEICVPFGVHGVWLVLGDPSMERTWQVFSSVTEGPGFGFPLIRDGDVLTYVLLPDCSKAQAVTPRVGQRSGVTLAGGHTHDQGPLRLSVRPNPAGSVAEVSLETANAEVAWSTVRLLASDGRVLEIDLEARSGQVARIGLSHLPPGVYHLLGQTTDSQQVQARVIKQ